MSPIQDSLAHLTAALADRYSIRHQLGAGGMATIYLADDLRHQRQVAIKVMRQDPLGEAGAERFLREIHTAARLQHPHLVPVFDSGDADGQLFFVMPLIEGESLRARLDRDKQLGVDEAVRLVGELADALDYAHREGIVHLDIKPENVLLSRGHALLADFGIARASLSSGAEQATQLVAAYGTPAYMSPEQIRGEQDVGPAADVYGLGCLLFEALAGEPPFAGTTVESMLVRRFTEPARRVRTLRADVPPACDGAIARALAREPAERHPSARAFAEALTTGAAPPADPPGARSIVVVPFDNMSPDPNDAYLADGLTEELIADLSRISALRVIARNSAVAARQRTRDLKEMARMLDVQYLLEGSVRRAGHQLRITAQLIDGATDAHLWAEKYTGTMDDVFEMQERISRTIVGELRVRLTEAEQRAPAPPVTDTETYELYLRARYMLGQSIMRMADAAGCLEEAMRRDPTFVPAFSAMGGATVTAGVYGLIEPRQAWTRVQALADHVLTVEPESAAAMQMQAAVAAYRDWRWDDATRLYRRAAELEAGNGFDRFNFALFLGFSGRIAEGLREVRQGRALDPLNFFGLIVEGLLHVFNGAWNDALHSFEQLIALDPQFPEGYHGKGYLLLVRDDPAGALTALQRACALSRRASWPVAKTGCALVRLGRVDEARAHLAELEQRSATEPILAVAVATLCLYLGDHAAFYRWMERALDQRDPFATALLIEPLWDAARGEPAFQELVRRVGLAS